MTKNVHVCIVDIFYPELCNWSPATPLPEGVSNPAVAVYKVHSNKDNILDHL